MNENNESHQRSTNGTYRKGRSGNPKGRPRGTPNKLTALARHILKENALDVLKAAIAAAKHGDVPAMRLILGLALPGRLRDAIEIPELNTPADVTDALGAIAQAAAAGIGEPDDIRATVAALEAFNHQLSQTLEIEQFIEVVLEAVSQADPECQRRILANLTRVKLGAPVKTQLFSGQLHE